MPALRAFSSTVSIPPRERYLAKRRAKALKHGQSLPTTNAQRAPKRKAKTPVPTLAATRKRRGVEYAYIDVPNGGYEVKLVQRRPSISPPVRIPYLPGQDDIPHSDAGSNSDSDTEMAEEDAPTDCIGYELVNPTEHNGTQGEDYDAEDDDAEGEDEGADAEDDDAEGAEGEDDDAEGEDDDAEGEDNNTGATFSAGNSGHTFPEQGRVDNSISTGNQWWPGNTHAWTNTPNEQLTGPNFISDASAEDIEILFSGLGDFPLEGSPPGGDCTFGSNDIGVESSAPSFGAGDAFQMRQLSQVVEHLQAQHSHSDAWPQVDHSLSPPAPQLSAQPNFNPIPSADTMLGLIGPNAAMHTPVTRANPLRHDQDGTRPQVRSTGVHISTRELVSRIRTNTRARSQSEPLALIPNPAPYHFDSDDGWPSTPVILGDTDIGLDESSAPPQPATQAKARAARLLNVRFLPRRLTRPNPARVPTIFDLRSNAKKSLKLSRKRRGRRTTPDARPLRVGLRAGELTSEQQEVMPLMELYVAKEITLVSPWPDDEDQLFADAKEYAGAHSRVTLDSSVMTTKFKETVLGKMSHLRGNPLGKIEYMMEREFEIAASDKDTIAKLMTNNLFLYPTTDRHPTQYFRVGVLSTALEILLFRSAKNLGLTFMELICKPDDAVKCSHWHKKLRDRSDLARQGMPLGIIAMAATMMFWALESLYVGKNIQFDEGHYQTVWEDYFRDLISLPHLGQLRKDLLDHIKEYYMDHWPASVPDADEVSPSAW